ncbi:N-acetyl sugar amidotransferase [Marinomonas piezotolerans]|uniref:N-acetyl sugar amidotransferase n=1 Tax=Marinomonas piezotolerans TaxID=2213058 RepID=A0A370U8D5_9GAMM|nr:N-acetyl sugar amidotransferase [Marinomonas piezotolerans]RDL44025.1 N-acetyl sugar amidotransferase [Marinomonas piezotolerans]
MNYCKRCLYPENHPLNLWIDEEGVCSGCRVHEEKYKIDWSAKEKELAELLNHYKERPGSSYDCVIPVSGTGDDFFVVDTIKNKFGLKPLLVTYNTHFNTKVGVRNLARLITELDCDHMYSTVGPDTVKEITRLTLQKIGDMYWHVLAGSATFPVQVATKLHIPLVIWGVNGWLDQVGMFSHHDRVEMTKKVRKEHALRRHDAETLIGGSDKVSDKDLQAFTYPSDEQLEKSRVRGLYLGNYVFWDSQKQIEDMIEKYGYETMEQERTFNHYESIYCWNNASVHDYVKFLKFGYGKVSDHASRDIRLKRMSREEGIELVKKYQDVKPQALNKFLQWVGLSEQQFMDYIEPFRDPELWRKEANGEWTLLDSIVNHADDEGVDPVRLEVNDPREYKLTGLMEEHSLDDDYILYGRAYMDEANYKAIEG